MQAQRAASRAVRAGSPHDVVKPQTEILCAMRTQRTWGRTALANKTAATWEGLVWDGRFRAKGKGGRVKGERRPSQCVEVPVVAHVTPFGNEARRLQAARRRNLRLLSPPGQPQPCRLKL